MGHDKLGNPRKIPALPVRLHITRGPSKYCHGQCRAGGRSRGREPRIWQRLAAAPDAVVRRVVVAEKPPVEGVSGRARLDSRVDVVLVDPAGQPIAGPTGGTSARRAASSSGRTSDISCRIAIAGARAASSPIDLVAIAFARSRASFLPDSFRLLTSHHGARDPYHPPKKREAYCTGLDTATTPICSILYYSYSSTS